jgi:hypothetical protein
MTEILEKEPLAPAKGATGEFQELERFAPDRFEDGRLAPYNQRA